MKVLPISIIFIFVNLLAAQNPYHDVRLKQVMIKKPVSNTYLEEMLVGKDNIFLLYKTSGSTSFKPVRTFVTKYDFDLSDCQIKEISFNYNGIDLSARFYLLLKKGIYAFCTFEDKKNKTQSIYSQLVKGDDLTTKPAKKIMEFKLPDDHVQLSFNYAQSPDSSKLLIYHEAVYTKANKTSLKLLLLTNEMKILKNDKIQLNSENNAIEFDRIFIDNTGNIVLLYQRGTKERQEHYLMSIPIDQNSKDEIPVDIPGKDIRFLNGSPISDGAILLTGIYSEKNNYAPAGCFSMIVTGPSFETSTNTLEFSEEFLTRYMSRKDKKKYVRRCEKGKDNNIFRYVVHDLQKTDKGYNVLYEQAYTTQVTVGKTKYWGSGLDISDYWGSGLAISTREAEAKISFNNDNLILANISSNGEINDLSLIPKSQNTTNENAVYASARLFIVDKQKYVFFNDISKNKKYQGEGPVKEFYLNTKSFLALVSPDENEYKRNSIISEKVDDIIVFPLVSKKISDNELVFYGRKRGKEKLIKLTFHKQ